MHIFVVTPRLLVAREYLYEDSIDIPTYIKYFGIICILRRKKIVAQ